MKAKLLRLILGLTALTSVLADDAAVASREDVMKLIEISGLLTAASNRFAETTTLGVVQKLKFASTNDLDQADIMVYQESQTLFREAAHRPGGLVDRIVPVYQRHLTRQEVSVLLRFYELDLATKLTRTGNQVGNELRDISKEWAQPQSEEWKKRLRGALSTQGIQFEIKPSSPKD